MAPAPPELSVASEFDYDSALLTYAGRQAIRARACAELERGASHNRTNALLGILRAAQHAGKEAVDHTELEQLRSMSRDLQAIRADQARMRSGVVREDEAPQLPDKGSAEPH